MRTDVTNICRITKEEAVGNIIESVALEESALAHILNAESEKLLAVVNDENVSAQQLLAINQSVESTISAILRLEMILQAKLKLFSDAICQQC